MKKLISLLLSIAIVLFIVTIPADASSYFDILGIDESQYDMALFYEHLWENYNHNMHGLLWEAVCDPQYYVYPQVVEEIGSDGWIEFASNITEEQLSKERYIEILSNLLVMMDYNTKDLIAEQVNADSTKKLKDYVVDVTGILVQTVSLDAAFGSHVTKNMERIATAMDLTWGFADFTIDTIEIYESLNRTLQQYENHREFLSAIAQNTTNVTLKDAALELVEATDKAFYCKVNAVADTASGLAGYLGQDVFFDTIVLEYMATDASVLGMSEDDVAVLGVLKSVYEYMGALQLAADIGVFAGDAIIGISDVMNRYNEMRALTDIRNALIQQMTNYRDSIQNVGDAEKIGKLCSLTKNLIYVNFRGEYCAHEMSTHDAQLYSLIIKINGQSETSDRVYEQAKENTEIYSMFVDMIFPELEFYCNDDGAHSVATDSSNLVTDAYTDAIVDGEWIYCYHIPQVNLLGNCGDSFNAKIYDQFYSLLTNDVYQSMEEYDYPYLSEMVYTWGQKADLVSIVIQTDQTMYAWTDFYVYTISEETGEEISYSELLAVYDLSEAEFYNLVKETLTEYWNSRKSDMISFVGEDFYNTLVERTIAEENIRDAIPYINSNGELCFVAYIYSAAGAEKYLHLLNTAGTADEGWIECTWDHFAEENETDTESPTTEGFAGNQTAEQLRKSIVGSWGREGAIVSDYDFISDGTCYWSFEKQIGGTYKIRDDKMLLITFPWMNDRYFWTEETYEEWRSHSSDDCWYMTDSGVLVLNGVSYYRDGKVIKDYNTEGGLLATIAGSWVLDDFTEYRFFMDGTYEENMVSVSYGILFSRVDIDAGPIEIVDDTHAKLWHEADSFGEIPYYTELVYDPETDTLRIGGSNNVYHRAEYSD